MTMPPRIVFFGTPQFATTILDILEEQDFSPTLIVTQPDTPQDRGMKPKPTPVSTWAHKHKIDVVTPSNLKPENIPDELLNSEWDLFIVAAYGNLIPKALLNIPKHGTMNYHPSLLPKLRGASPVRTAILTDARDAVGVSIILLDEEMDHGPILAQAKIALDEWPIGALTLEALLAEQGGILLAETIPLHLQGSINPEPQEHAEATFSKKIVKEDSRIELADDGALNFRKYCAYEGWPGIFFISKQGDKDLRIKITKASFENGIFSPKKVIPEGKKEMLYADYMRGLQQRN